jgi:hypothetical protein
MWLKSMIRLAVDNCKMKVSEETSQQDIIVELTSMIFELSKRSVAVFPLVRFSLNGVILSFNKIHEQLCSCQFLIRLIPCLRQDVTRIQGFDASNGKSLFTMFVSKHYSDVPIFRNPTLASSSSWLVSKMDEGVFKHMIRLVLTERQIYVNHLLGQCPRCQSCTMSQLITSDTEELIEVPRKILDVAGS